MELDISKYYIWVSWAHKVPSTCVLRVMYMDLGTQQGVISWFRIIELHYCRHSTQCQRQLVQRHLLGGSGKLMFDNLRCLGAYVSIDTWVVWLWFQCHLDGCKHDCGNVVCYLHTWKRIMFQANLRSWILLMNFCYKQLSLF